MESAFPAVLESGRIRVLLVPVHPITQDSFRKYVDLLTQYSVVYLGDLTPPRNHGIKFLDQLFHSGHLYYNFVTSYNKEHAPLEDFQLSRQVMGVIGVMHCQQVESMAKGYSTFQEILKRVKADRRRGSLISEWILYPSSLANRCFAFEPLDSQVDDVKGPIMIPNVGQLAFYLSTMISDFSAEMLKAFANMACNIEKRSLISGPNMMMGPTTTYSTTPALQQQQSSSFSSSSQPSSSNMPAFPGSTYNPLVPPTSIASPALAASGFSSSGTSMASSSTFTPVSATSSSAVSGAGGGSSETTTPGGSGFGNLGGLLSSDKNKKRTPGRAMKLIADLFLMAGRADIAASTYQSAIEQMKSNTDYTWLAAALEALLCATMFSTMANSGVGPRSPNSSVNSLPRMHRDGDKPISIGQVIAPPCSNDIFIACEDSAQMRTLICEICDRFREIVLLYEKGILPGQQGFYPINQIAACIRLSKFLYQMRKHRFNNVVSGGASFPFQLIETNNVMSDIVASMGGAAIRTGVSGTLSAASGSEDRIILNNGHGVSRPDISSWLMKAWGSGVEYLTPSDQIWTATSIASVYGLLGYKRKHAFFLRQISMLVLATMKTSSFTRRLSGIPSLNGSMENLCGLPESSPVGEMAVAAAGFTLITDGVAFPETDAGPTTSNTITTQFKQSTGGKTRRRKTNGALECMKRVCDVLGIGSKGDLYESAYLPLAFVKDQQANQESDDEDDWLDDYLDGTDLDAHFSSSTNNLLTEDSQTGNTMSKMKLQLQQNASIASRSRTRYGWPALQIDVLKECIDIAESIEDHTNTIIYTARLLRRLHKHLSKQEQLNLFETLQSVVVKTRARHIEEPGSGELNSSQENIHSQGKVSVLVKGIAGGVIGVPVLRRLEVVRQAARKTPHQHPISKLNSAETIAASGVKDPFLYNPYAKQGKKTPTEVLLVENEVAYFDVTLANPFSFDLDVQSITIRASGVVFQSHPASTIIPAESRIHAIRLSGIPTSNGTLHIHGCTVRMFGGSIEENIDPVRKILEDPRKRTKEGKKKKQDDRERLGKRLAFLKPTQKAQIGPSAVTDSQKNWSIPIKVIPAQPIMQAVLQSPANVGCMMLFEGEVTQFPLHLENIGQTPIDYIVVTFAESYQTSTTAIAAEETAAVKETPESNYERDIVEYGSRVLWMHQQERKLSPSGRMVSFKPFAERIESTLLPGQGMDLCVGSFGKRNTTGGTIKIEYGYIRRLDKDGQVLPSPSEGDESSSQFFFTRQIFVPILITVQTVLSVLNTDMLLLGGFESDAKDQESDMATPLNRILSMNEKSLSLEEMMADPFGIAAEKHSPGVSFPAGTDINAWAADKDKRNKDYCLLTFDLRNQWSNPFEICFEIYDDNDASSGRPSHTTSTIIHAGCTKRIMLPLKRIWLDEAGCTKDIPVPDWKQFVLGKTQTYSELEDRVRKMMFWYKDALIGNLHQRGRVVSKWNFSQKRCGFFSMRSMRMTKRMLNVLKTEEISYSISLNVVTSGDDTPNTFLASSGGDSSFTCPVGSLIEINWRILNRKDVPLVLSLRIQPCQDHHNGHVELQTKDKLMILGSLQDVLPPIPPHGGTFVFKLPMLLLSKGDYKFLYHAEMVTSSQSHPQKAVDNVYWGAEPIHLTVK